MDKPSKKWKKLAKNLFGTEDGYRHCHWCSNRVNMYDCEVHCGVKASGIRGRIRSWDGQLAKDCKHFKLEPWYTKDENYGYFKKGDK